MAHTLADNMTWSSNTATYNDRIETLRIAEYPSLTETTYLDHAGATLYPLSLIDAYHQDLKSNLYGNPHSDSPASNLSTQKVDQARLSALQYFNADPEYFDIVFTANATAAIKLVADCFRDQDFWYGFHKDAHSSIVGVREVASLGSDCFTSAKDVEKWISQRRNSSMGAMLSLFAYPAQSNMTGYRPPLTWSKRVRDSGTSDTEEQQTYVLLDAASYLTTGRLDFGDHEAAPDFVALSFYKIFGFPDLGALIVRKTAQKVLTRRRYFGGGTVDAVTVIGSAYHAKKTSTIHDFLEDGTLPFHNIVALTHAISIHEKLFISAQAISSHTGHLSACLYQHLTSMRHFNDVPVVKLHKDAAGTYGDTSSQGPIFAFSVVRSDGSYIGKSHFERLAIDCGFQIRTGGVCNPGGIASTLGLSSWELKRNYTEGARCGGEIDLVCGKPTGIIRVSLGPMSTLGDVRRFAVFMEWFFVEKTASFIDSSTTLCSSDHRPTAPEILPIKGCPAIFAGNKHHHDACRVWHQQWCIVESISGEWQELSTSQLLQDLQCSLEPEKGKLRISHTDRDDLCVSLWDRPNSENDLVTQSRSSNNSFDAYTDEHIEQWLSSALRIPCTLARYRGPDAKLIPDARTCVLSTCKTQFATRDDLFRHYKSHAAHFQKAHPLQCQTQCSVEHDGFSRGHCKQQPSTTTSIESKETWVSRQSTTVPSIVLDNDGSLHTPKEGTFDVRHLQSHDDVGDEKTGKKRKEKRMPRWRTKLAAFRHRILCR